MSYCALLMKNDNFFDVWFLYQVIMIKTLTNLFTMFSTNIFFPSYNIVYIAISLHELLSSVCVLLEFLRCRGSNSSYFKSNLTKLIHTAKGSTGLTGICPKVFYLLIYYNIDIYL